MRCNTPLTLLSVAAIGATTAFVSLSPASTPRASFSPGELDRALSTADDLSIAFAHAAETVAPSVVNVRSTVRIEASARTPQIPDRFRRFFDDDFFDIPGQPQPRERFRSGQGSGFVVSSDGLILTNNHVVEDATEVTVQLRDDREFVAEVVGTDPSTDLALLRIDASDLTPVTFADSDDIRVGSWVVAAGNPFGLESTITSGIVSATERTRVGIADYEDFIQTDAAINPGNSGGPLVNLRGEVVGVNTAIASRTGGNLGISFAIPSNLAVSIMENLKDDGVVTRGYLGVIIQDLDENLARSFGYDGDDGVLISEVQEGGPADEAGLRAGDIITSFDDELLDGVDALRLRVADTEPGEEVRLDIVLTDDIEADLLDIVREDAARTIDVTIGELETGVGGTPVSQRGLTERLGMTLRDLDSALAERLGTDLERGVVVTRVEPASPAADAGLRPGDIILRVHDDRVDDVSDLRSALREHDLAEGVRLTVRTQGTQRFVFLRDRDAD